MCRPDSFVCSWMYLTQILQSLVFGDLASRPRWDLQFTLRVPQSWPAGDAVQNRFRERWKPLQNAMPPKEKMRLTNPAGTNAVGKEEPARICLSRNVEDQLLGVCPERKSIFKLWEIQLWLPLACHSHLQPRRFIKIEVRSTKRELDCNDPPALPLRNTQQTDCDRSGRPGDGQDGQCQAEQGNGKYHSDATA